MVIPIIGRIAAGAGKMAGKTASPVVKTSAKIKELKKLGGQAARETNQKFLNEYLLTKNGKEDNNPFTPAAITEKTGEFIGGLGDALATPENPDFGINTEALVDETGEVAEELAEETQNKLISKKFSPMLNAKPNFSKLKTVGGIGALLLVLVVVHFAIVVVKPNGEEEGGGYTRFQLLLKTLTLKTTITEEGTTNNETTTTTEKVTGVYGDAVVNTVLNSNPVLNGLGTAWNGLSGFLPN